MAAIKNILKDLDVSKDHDPESIKAFFMEEIWKDIPGYEGHYQVSNQGRVKSFKRKTTKYLKPQLNNKTGYMQLALCLNGVLKKRTVHQLVAETFLNHKPDGTLNIVVDHIDRDKTNNCLLNIRLVSQRENTSKRKNKTSKYTGVYWEKKRKKWRSAIVLNGVQKYLGRFSNEHEAHLAYQKELELVTNKNQTI